MRFIYVHIHQPKSTYSLTNTDTENIYLYIRIYAVHKFCGVCILIRFWPTLNMCRQGSEATGADAGIEGGSDDLSSDPSSSSRGELMLHLCIAMSMIIFPNVEERDNLRAIDVAMTTCYNSDDCLLQ